MRLGACKTSLAFKAWARPLFLAVSEAPQPSAHQKHQIGKLTPWMANDFTEVSNATFLGLGWHLRFDVLHSRDLDSES